MIGRTNTGGGGGGLSPNSAVIHVNAPVGSTISFAKGGVIVKVLGPEKSHVNSDSQSRADWYYPVGSSNFGTWTVTASLATDSASANVIVSSNVQYDLILSYHVPIETYQEVEYLEATGTQYILAGLTSENVDGYDCGFQFRQQYSGNTVYAIAGTRYNVSGNFRAVEIVHWAGKIAFDPVSGYNEPPMDTSKHTIQVGEKFNWISTLDGNVISSTHSSLPTGSYAVGNFALFAAYAREGSGTSTRYQSKSRIYYLTLYHGNTVQREFYPCYRRSDSVAGMYDKTNGVFYTNNGSGTFVVGPDVQG